MTEEKDKIKVKVIKREEVVELVRQYLSGQNILGKIFLIIDLIPIFLPRMEEVNNNGEES